MPLRPCLLSWGWGIGGMIAQIEIQLNGCIRRLFVELWDYNYEVTVGEVAWRMHSALQVKKHPTSYFDDRLEEACDWVFDRLYDPSEYQITQIDMVGEYNSGRIPHDDFKDMKTPTVTRKPRKQVSQTLDLGIQE